MDSLPPFNNGQESCAGTQSPSQQDLGQRLVLKTVEARRRKRRICFSTERAGKPSEHATGTSQASRTGTAHALWSCFSTGLRGSFSRVLFFFFFLQRDSIAFVMSKA